MSDPRPDGSAPSGEGRPARPTRSWPNRPALSGELVERLNREWRITALPSARTPKQRFSRPLRQLLAALFRPQESFNSALVQHLNELRQVNDAAFERQDSLRAMVEDVFFRTELLFDRIEEQAGRLGELAAHIGVHVKARFDDVEATVDELRRFPEAFAAAERRMHDAVVRLRDEQAEMRTAVGVLRHETQHLSRLLAAAGPATVSQPVGAPAETTGPSDPLSHKYVGFEDAFRGSPESIRAGLASYVPIFAGTADVLDVGCGRGEFLVLLREAGISARGIDLNESMVEQCRMRGVEATVADALAYLQAQPDGSLGGLFAAQVVEHLRPGYLTHLLDAAVDKLRPGAPIVLETINPACWFAFFSSYVRDITHERPLHPDTLKFLLVASGFQHVEISYRAPYPEHEKLQPVTPSLVGADTAETLNANADKLNRLLFTYMDYAAIGRRP